MSKLTWLRSLVVPVIILSILCLAFAFYFLYWVPNRERHLDDRGFRYLKTLSDEIRLTFNTYDKMMDNAVNAGVTTEDLPSYLSNVAPELDVPEQSETVHVIDHDYDDPPKIAVMADEGTHFLYLAFNYVKGPNDQRSTKSRFERFAVRTDLDKLINGLLGPFSSSPFDIVLVAKPDGRVIFQKSLSGVEVAQMKNLKDASGEAKPGTERQIGIEALIPTSRLEEVSIAGARYRLYSQPVQVGFLPANPGGKSNEPSPSPANTSGEAAEKGEKENSNLRSTKKASSANSANHPSDSKSTDEQTGAKVTAETSDIWVLCGLVRADRFRSESQLIPYLYILIILAAILLSATSYPFLRLYLSNPGERLRSAGVTIAAVLACVVVAVLAFSFVDVYYWSVSFGLAAHEDMERLANAINANFNREQSAAYEVLDNLDEKLGPIRVFDTIRKTMGSDAGATVKLRVNRDAKEVCYPPEACKVDILSETKNDIYPLLKRYPYPFFAFWSDSEGNQLIKWTTRNRPTPFVPLDDPSVPYYPDVQRALKRQGDSAAIATRGIGSQYSPTTGQNITTFWKVVDGPATGEGEDNPEKAKGNVRYSAALVTRPISVFNAVLPGGYQFAIVAPDGMVVFHSDTTRNLRENFFAETDQNPGLRSRVLMRSTGPVVANYQGRPHRMYVRPMDAANQDGGWSVIVFRDLHLEEVMNLEILSLVSIIFLGYAVAVALVLLLVYLVRSRRPNRPWFWPDARKGRTYWWATVANYAAALLLVFLIHTLLPLALLLCAGVFPLALLLVTLIIFGPDEDEQKPANVSLHWRTQSSHLLNRWWILWRSPTKAEPLSAASKTQQLKKKRAGLQTEGSDGNQVPVNQPNENPSPLWKTGYFRACTTLLVVIVVMPCLCFFKVAADFEQRLFIEHAQLQLASDLEGRDKSMQELYRFVDLGVYREDVLGMPEYQRAGELDGEMQPPTDSKPVFSYHELLLTTIESREPLAERPSEKWEVPILGCRPLGPSKDEYAFLSCISYPYNERADNDRHLAEGGSDSWSWSLGPIGDGQSRLLTMTKHEPHGSNRSITSIWVLFRLPWNRWTWWLGVAVFLTVLYGVIRQGLKRIFLLDLIAPPPAKETAAELKPSSLMSDLPMNLLIIGPETSRPIASLLHRTDLQFHEAEELLPAAVAQSQPAGDAKTGQGPEEPKALQPSPDRTDDMIRDGRPLLLRNFDRVLDDNEKSAKAYAAVMRLVSRLENTVIILSNIDPVLIRSIEGSERWRLMLRSFVRIDLHSTARQRREESEEDYQNRVSADSYFHWLIAGLPTLEKLVMLQLAQERVVNPCSSSAVYDLMEQGLIERRWGLMAVKDESFAEFLLGRAVPHHTVKAWEKEVAGTRPLSLQTSLLIIGVGVVAFLIYTQGEVFNTWVTYVTGFAASLPKILQVFDSFRTKSGSKA